MIDNFESFYHFSPEDFGQEIHCEVTSHEHQSMKGKPKRESLKFGPFELLPIVRQEIENNLVSGSCMYSGFVRVNPKAAVKADQNGISGEDRIRESKGRDNSVSGIHFIFLSQNFVTIS